MGILELLPLIGTLTHTVQAVTGDAPTAAEWTASSLSTGSAWVTARLILARDFWDDLVGETETIWDDLALKAARGVLAVLAVKPSEMKRTDRRPVIEKRRSKRKADREK